MNKTDLTVQANFDTELLITRRNALNNLRGYKFAKGGKVVKAKNTTVKRKRKTRKRK